MSDAELRRLVAQANRRMDYAMRKAPPVTDVIEERLADIEKLEKLPQKFSTAEKKSFEKWERTHPRMVKAGRAGKKVGGYAKTGFVWALKELGSTLKAGLQGSVAQPENQRQPFAKHYDPDRYVDEHRGRVQRWRHRNIFDYGKGSSSPRKKGVLYSNKYERWKNKGLFDYGYNRKPKRNKKGFFDFGRNSKSRGRGFFDW